MSVAHAPAAHWLESESGFPDGGIGGAEVGAGTAVVANARGLVLCQRHLDEVVAFGEFLAGAAFTNVERAELSEDITDAFEDSPHAALKHLRPLAGGIRRIRTLDPVRRAERRFNALTASYVTEIRRRADDAEASPIMRIVERYNPVLRYWASTGVVLAEHALTARGDQHALVLGLVGREPAADLRDRLLARATTASAMENAELATSEARLLAMRRWLRELGDTAAGTLRDEVARAVDSALDVDIVVQQLGFRAALATTPPPRVGRRVARRRSHR